MYFRIMKIEIFILKVPIKCALYAMHDFFTGVVTPRGLKDFYSTMKYANSTSDCSATTMFCWNVVWDDKNKNKKSKTPTFELFDRPIITFRIQISFIIMASSFASTVVRT